MSKISLESHDKVAETLLLPLYARAVESRHPNPILRDLRAQQLVEQIDYDFSRHELKGHDLVTTVMRARQFDRYVQGFLSRHPDAVVVNIGCGLDTRFERLDNQQLSWYNLDLPEVIAFRQQLIPEMERCATLPCSVFDEDWVESIRLRPGQGIFFNAEAVFPYFPEQQVKQVFIRLADKFPGCELVCDGMTPAMIRMLNLNLIVMKMDARLHWGLKSGRQPETWRSDIHLLDEWFYFDQPEPRLGSSQVMRHFRFFARGVGIFHYQLGEPVISPN
jgi:O-methyltransferase involved in polyketide biosynthesis